MSHPTARKSSPFRRHGSARHLTVWLTLLVQLHLFFVLELHHHVLEPFRLRDAVTACTAWTNSHSAQPRQPLCPACQVARQGAVYPSTGNVVRFPLQAVVGTLPARTFKLSAIFLFHPSGRAPPRG